MEVKDRRTDTPVLLLHNMDPSWEPEASTQAIEAVEELEVALRQQGHPVLAVPVRHRNLGRILENYNPESWVVLNWCEELPGMPHSDALVASTLEALGFTYTGAPPEVLARSWDKAATKSLLDGNGVPTPDGIMCSGRATVSWNRFPAIVKPAFEHCSTGITSEAVVLDEVELANRVAFVWEVLQQPALVEDFIDGREFHVTLCGNGVIDMLPPAEMDFTAFENVRDRLCTFDSKFTPGSDHYEKIELRVPAPLDEREHARLWRTAERAYRVFGCRDYARIDLRFGNGRYYVLDVNPNADLSPDTSLVYAAQAAGLSYGAFGSLLVDLAVRRHPILCDGPNR